MNSPPMAEIGLDRIKCRLTNWHDALPSPLAEESNRPIVEIHRIEVQINNLADPTARSIEKFTQCATARCIRAGEVALIGGSSEGRQ